MSRSDLLDKICVLLGGRVAEELHFGDVTTGASNDLERATQIARQIVTEFGMSDKLGLVKLGHKHQEVFFGRDIGEEKNYSDEVAYTIDQEVKKIIDSCYGRVNHLLTENADEMAKVAQVLLEKEVIEGKELTLLLGMEEKEEKNESPAEKEKPERESPGVLSEDSRTPNVLGEAPAD